MNRDSLYNEGDFVKYLGDYTIQEGLLREPGLGRIDHFETPFEEERIFLWLLGQQKNIWCDYNKIRPIETTETHLNKIGFQTIVNDKIKKYTLGDINISGTYIRLNNQNFHFISGLCLADFTERKKFNLNKYLNNNEFYVEAFYSDYPSLSNINDLFRLLDQKHIAFDAETIILE